jgi:hypothetical protein
VAAPLKVLAGPTLPQSGSEHDTVHFTPLPLGSLPSVATIFGTLLVASTLSTDVGLMEMVTEGTVMVTVSDFVESSTEVTVIVAVKSLAGGLEGAP